jgi:transcriptional regulator with XRE-family HTH domain
VLDADHVSRLLAAAVRARRLERGLTQEDAAHLCGVRISAFGRLERGETDPVWSTVVRVAAGLDVSLDEIVAVSET